MVTVDTSTPEYLLLHLQMPKLVVRPPYSGWRQVRFFISLSFTTLFKSWQAFES
jgi:hypothetical protein